MDKYPVFVVNQLSHAPILVLEDVKYIFLSLSLIELLYTRIKTTRYCKYSLFVFIHIVRFLVARLTFSSVTRLVVVYVCYNGNFFGNKVFVVELNYISIFVFVWGLCMRLSKNLHISLYLFTLSSSLR